MLGVREQFIKSGLSNSVADFLMQAWRPGTARQYDCYLTKYYYYCLSENVDPYSPDLNFVLEYLLLCFNQGLGLSVQHYHLF